MDIAHQSLPKSLSFIARIVLGMAAAVAGTILGILISELVPSSELVPIVVGSAVGGLIAGYILKKHFFWALLIPIVVFITSVLSTIKDPDPYTEAEIAGYLLIFTALPVYLGALFGYLISKRVSARRARSQ